MYAHRLEVKRSGIGDARRRLHVDQCHFISPSPTWDGLLRGWLHTERCVTQLPTCDPFEISRSSACPVQVARSCEAVVEARLLLGCDTDLRERIVDHGRRNAYERMAHLIYEMLVRYRVIGAAKDDAFEFPITQSDAGPTRSPEPGFAHAELPGGPARGRDCVAPLG